MNVAFFLTPKSQVVWVSASGTLGQAIERTRPNGYTAVPILDDEGGYLGTLTEGDILWHLLAAAEPWPVIAGRTPLLAVARRTKQAAFIRRFPECDAACVSLADRNRDAPSR